MKISKWLVATWITIQAFMGANTLVAQTWPMALHGYWAGPSLRPLALMGRGDALQLWHAQWLEGEQMFLKRKQDFQQGVKDRFADSVFCLWIRRNQQRCDLMLASCYGLKHRMGDLNLEKIPARRFNREVQAWERALREWRGLWGEYLESEKAGTAPFHFSRQAFWHWMAAFSRFEQGFYQWERPWRGKMNAEFLEPYKSGRP